MISPQDLLDTMEAVRVAEEVMKGCREEVMKLREIEAKQRHTLYRQLSKKLRKLLPKHDRTCTGGLSLEYHGQRIMVCFPSSQGDTWRVLGRALGRRKRLWLELPGQTPIEEIAEGIIAIVAMEGFSR